MTSQRAGGKRRARRRARSACRSQPVLLSTTFRCWRMVSSLLPVRAAISAMVLPAAIRLATFASIAVRSKSAWSKGVAVVARALSCVTTPIAAAWETDHEPIAGQARDAEPTDRSAVRRTKVSSGCLWVSRSWRALHEEAGQSDPVAATRGPEILLGIELLVGHQNTPAG